jgi:glutamine amidotransferase
MKILKEKNFDKLLKKLINTKILIMGICLGMQLLFKDSEEAISEKGVGFFDGKVEKINSKYCNIPLLGWYETTSEKNILLNQKNFYFNNKYSCVPVNDRYNLSYLDLIEYKIIASIKKDNVIGFQFHPEKSSKNGHEIIKDFLKDGKF